MTQRFKRRAGVSMALAWLPACGGLPHSAAPTFPQGESRWEIPLIDPLTSRNPYVMAALESPKGTVELRLLVDSGAFGSGLTPQTLQALGVEVDSARVQVQDVAGIKRTWKGGAVPKVTLGPLRLQDMVFMVMPKSDLIGRNLLNEHPWEIDPDRGVLVLGAAPLTAEGVTTLEMTRRDGDHYIEAQLGGTEQLLYFDTGASQTSIDEETAIEAGFKRVALKHAATFETVHAKIKVTAEYLADLSFAGLNGGRVALAPLPNFKAGSLFNQKVVGLLGYDALSMFRFRVTPGDSIQFAPRTGLVATARQRIERWPQVPRCADAPGCVQVGPVTFTDHLAVDVTYVEDHATPTAFLLSCVGKDGTIPAHKPFLEIFRNRARKGTTDHIEAGRPEADEVSRYSAGILMEDCPRMVLMDVNPGTHHPLTGDGYAYQFRDAPQRRARRGH